MRSRERGGDFGMAVKSVGLDAFAGGVWREGGLVLAKQAGRGRRLDPRRRWLVDLFELLNWGEAG